MTTLKHLPRVFVAAVLHIHILLLKIKNAEKGKKRQKLF